MLCQGVTKLVAEAGVVIRTSTSVVRLSRSEDRVRSVELADTEQIDADIVVSTLPAPVYMGLAPEDTTPGRPDGVPGDPK